MARRKAKPEKVSYKEALERLKNLIKEEVISRQEMPEGLRL